jgi:SH3 domain-containing protein 19
VQPVEESHQVASLPSDLLTGPRCVARFDYEAGEPDDLDFMSGDVIRIVERVNVEWLRGELRGKTGVFPVAFVEILEDLPISDSAAASQGNLMSQH